MAEEAGQFRYIVRVAGTDLDGRKKLAYGLAGIKGIGYTTAVCLLRMLNIDPEKRTGFLSDEEISRIEKAISEISASNLLPKWMLNRRKDYETGDDIHLIGSELIFKVKQDIEREKKIKSWRGIRHSLGLKVRGQRTHTTGRLGVTVGVSKKKTAAKPQSSEQKS
ncbi:30S ribosomal protein S13 [Fervidicoccus fontis]|jgi:small subunit ribosomal protein S13|uniref:Small ribosomal subunit protein uS13 n=2 Tax=Fervidicoccus fontis TaxID=683846 RepID=I0A0F0_FERFK|nr:30S ribosomal protein S13 [Fervidicoccus fontis]AFH42457.1 30S ribosomal protein S13P [Fervidicoccus fontis Kam940]MBE9391071.1 30S ribosomal protein S13 [Fervidicoccus fontis]PMB76048.1 MAG: 30S ribosomal protein S13 [Fervidicoccus fontis]HEW63665.1 30S ribosomal protein S13 [Fervidicoccus fontis]